MRIRIVLQWLIVFSLLLQLTACNYGIFGKGTAGKIDSVNKTLKTVVGHAQDSVLDLVMKTREEIFDYLKNSSTKEAHDLSLGIMQGTIGYLGDSANRDYLAHFIDSIITHTAGATSRQLIQFKDQLLDPVFIRQTQSLLRGIMQELVLHPTDNLLTLVLSDRTRVQLDKMLEMIVPAVLNDKAIEQVSKLRGALLGPAARKDVALLLDTVLRVANYRLDSTLRPTIHSIVDENTSTFKKNAGWIIAALGALVIITGLVVYFVQRRKVMETREMLRQVTVQIERMNKTGALSHAELTSNIKDAMDTAGLEPKMNQFLDKEHVRSNAAAAGLSKT
jgi:hypothetical protein